MFGQANSAESHLRRLGVGGGDVFLFFGWFRQVELAAGRYRYARAAPDIHCLFGWLQVERRFDVADLRELPEWARQHPHVKRAAYHPAHDSIYIATERLVLPRRGDVAKGGGVFPQFVPELVLTAPGQLRSRWEVPSWLVPNGRTPLSYHASHARWLSQSGQTYLQSVGRGQEFVLPADEYPEAEEWVESLFRASSAAGARRE